MTNLEQFLKREEFILLDGAMGTQLEKVGLPMGGEANLTHPDEVVKIHQDYGNSGAEILITNTLTMNRPFIKVHRLDVDVRKVNLAGAKLARAGSTDQFVLGDISSTGILIEPFGPMTEGEAETGFREQVEILEDGGVDGFIIETMFDLREALLALRACRAVTDLPVIATIAFSTHADGGRTIMGDSAVDCARQLSDAGADVVGANCGDLNPEQIAQVIAVMREAVELPLLAQPNAGSPELIQGKTEFRMGPGEFAAGIKKCINAGASLVGGCCGTTPEHIEAVSACLKRGEK